MSNSMESQAAEACRQAFGPQARVSHVRDITSGAENHVFALDVVLDVEREAGAAALPLVLKLYSHGVDAARNETDVMRKLAAADFPVPEVHHVELDPQVLGLPFSLLRRIEGRTLGDVMRSAPNEAGAWLRRFAELAARLHALDPLPFLPKPKSAGECLDHGLARYEQSLRELEVPELRPVYDWLLARRSTLTPRGPSLIHMDYHPLNVMVDPGGQLLLLDFSLAHVTDPRRDLAQTFQMLASSGFAALRAPIVAAYEQASGSRLEEMDFFDVFAALINVAGQYAVLDDGETKRPALWNKLSRRPGWLQRVEHLGRGAPSLARTYRRITELSGVRVPEAEALFARLGAEPPAIG